MAKKVGELIKKARIGAGLTQEQLASVIERVGRFLEGIKGAEGNILISTHAIAMKGALEYLTPASQGTYWSKYIGNCAVYAVESRTDLGYHMN
mgnify:CR=1 FL=1